MPLFRTSLRRSAILVVLFFLLASGAWPSTARAQSEDDFDGKYRCVRIEVGQQAGRCQSPPLILHRDGSYQIWGEHGSYEVVQGQWLVLSHSKRRGLGRFVSAREIVFEYEIDGKRCRVTFQRLYDPPPGFRWS